MNKTILTVIFSIIFLTNIFSQEIWQEFGSGMTQNTINTLYTDGSRIYAGGQGGGIFYTDNNGLNWTKTATGLTDTRVFSILRLGDVVFAGLGSNPRGINKADLSLAAWSFVEGFSWNTSILSMVSQGDDILAGGGEGIYYSNNAGANWVRFNTGITTNVFVRTVFYKGTTMFAGVQDHGLLRSTNNGVNWTIHFNNSFAWINEIKEINNKLYICTDKGVYASTNNGDSWNALAPLPNNAGVKTILGHNNTLIIGGDNVYFSNNGGATWENFGQGLTMQNLNVSALTKNNDYIFASTYSNKVWRRSLGVVGISSNTTAHSYSLSQNYPNPFNPSTTIHYSIVKSGNVSLTVYDCTGKEVNTLVNSHSSAGNYYINFDGSSLSSGVYYYKITTGDFSETKKMLLVK